jgi:LGFP repeat-containing protein
VKINGRPVETVDASGGHGVQVGSGNVQHNHMWASKPLMDPASLSALSPDAAIERIRQMSHHDVRDLFARASPDDVAEVLAVWLVTDEAEVIAVLAGMKRRKVRELIKPLAAEAEWLAELAEAADAISRCATAVKWGSGERLERIPGGYARNYKDGRVLWCESHGAHPVGGVIEEYRKRNTFLGFPMAGQECADMSPSGTDGVRQPFEGGMVYASENGAHALNEASVECFAGQGGSGGWLGFPVTDMGPTVTFEGVQHFEGGGIYRVWMEGTFAVRKDMAEAVSSAYGGFAPCAREDSAQKSPLGTSGRKQLITCGGLKRTAVYFSAEHGAVVIAPEAWTYYSNLGAEASWLGFPVDRRQRGPLPGSGSQKFEGGVLYWRPGTDPIPVSGFKDLLSHDPKEPGGQLGFPVSAEMPIGADDRDRIQLFENGVITWWDGWPEIWLRPVAPQTPAPPPSPWKPGSPSDPLPSTSDPWAGLPSESDPWANLPNPTDPWAEPRSG